MIIIYSYEMASLTITNKRCNDLHPLLPRKIDHYPHTNYGVPLQCDIHHCCCSFG